MSDTWIIVAVAILFPLFGAAVFFYWRIQYGVGVPWLTRRASRSQTDDADVVVTRFQPGTDGPSSPRDQGAARPPE